MQRRELKWMGRRLHDGWKQNSLNAFHLIELGVLKLGLSMQPLHIFEYIFIC